MNSTAIRRINVARVFHAVRENPGCSQRVLADRTGLDKATISAVVGQLVDQRLLERTELARSRRVGRPEVALTIPLSAGLLIGARLEPTTIQIVATTLAGTPIRRLAIRGSRDIQAATALLRDGITEITAAIDQAPPLRGIGVGVPALMDRTGRLVLAPNLGWRDTPIRPLLQQALDAPVYVDNDTKAATIGEKLFGSCRDVDDFIYVTAHSGVGGGLMLGGRLYRGTNGFAGEIGHVTVVPDGRPCGCGKRGCLETYASEAAILAEAARRGAGFPDLWAVAAAARAGDAVAAALLDEAGGWLGMALSHLVNLVNPMRLVLGGGLAIVAEFLIPAILRVLDRHALEPLRRELQVHVSPLGDDDVPMGGIALALEGFLALPEAVLPELVRAG